MKNGLAELLSPEALVDFFTLYKKNEPFVVHDNQELLKTITELPFLVSLDKLLLSWPMPVEAHLPDVQDEVSAIQIDVSEAKKHFNEGFGLLFNEAHNLSPVLIQWLEKIREALGLSALSYGRCLLYATPDQKGTAPHFDQNCNFVIQLQGTKIWTMAANQHVQNPMTRHTMGQMTDPELASYLQQELPTQMPAKTVSFELKAGSLLFVPRGWWHTTEAKGDALALNFTYTAPTWIDLLTAALRSRLAQSSEWRETAGGLSDPAQRVEAEKKFDALLAALTSDLPFWKAKDILNATEA